MAEHILWTMMSHHSTGAWFSEGIAARGDADQQGVFACVLQTVLLELRSCLRHLAPTHTHMGIVPTTVRELMLCYANNLGI